MFNPTEYARAWRAKNREHYRNYNRNLWHTKKKFKRRAAHAESGQNRCVFCNKLLDRDLKCKKYCKSCRQSSGPKLYLQRIYQLRAKQRREGIPQTEIISNEKQRKTEKRATPRQKLQSGEDDCAGSLAIHAPEN